MREIYMYLPNSDSELLIPNGIFPHHHIQVTIHEDCALNIVDDSFATAEFEAHNERRSNKKLVRHFSVRRYRLICPPRILDENLKLDVAPIDFAYFALLEDQDIDANVRDHIFRRIADASLHISPELESTHEYVNKNNYVPLGIEFVLITNDKKTLLRRRGRSVATAQETFDVSFSGYCGGDSDLDENGQLQVWKTVRSELAEEIDIPTALDREKCDPDDIRFTALHRNANNGTTDLLGYWQVDISSQDLGILISKDFPGLQDQGPFPTTEMAEEEFVWDTDNTIVDFDGEKIVDSLQRAGKGVPSIIPEARVALDLALEAFGKPKLR
jgi:hypothetical protein